jgi:hypothetical protein
MSATAVGELLAALVVIITLARVFGALARRCGQPAVVGEILAGVVLGPTFFGAGLANHLFPVTAVRPALVGVGDLGLVLFMFIVGYELDRKLVLSSGRATVTAIVVDPAEMSGRALERFTSQLATSGATPKISARMPDDALIVARQDGSQAGAHLVVRAGPGYIPAEPVPLVVAGLGQEDR